MSKASYTVYDHDPPIGSNRQLAGNCSYSYKPITSGYLTRPVTLEKALSLFSVEVYNGQHHDVMTARNDPCVFGVILLSAMQGYFYFIDMASLVWIQFIAVICVFYMNLLNILHRYLKMLSMSCTFFRV